MVCLCQWWPYIGTSLSPRVHGLQEGSLLVLHTPWVWTTAQCYGVFSAVHTRKSASQNKWSPLRRMLLEGKWKSRASQSETSGYFLQQRISSCHPWALSLGVTVNFWNRCPSFFSRLVPSGFHMVSDILKRDVNVNKYFYQVACLSVTSLINKN